jgi:single-strand DNA-binding protein
MKKLQVIGNLTSDVELKQIKDKDGKDLFVANVTVAVNGRDDKATYIPITVWGKDAVNLEKYNNKGSKLHIEADVENNNYEKDGKKIYGLKFNATSIQYLDSKKKEGGEEQK